MKRAIRISLKVLLVLAVIAAGTVLLCVDTVDRRPYFEEPYYAETVARLRTRAQTNQLAAGELRAGVASVCLSPTLNASNTSRADGRFRALPLAGYGNRKGKPAAGVHDDVHVKAVAFKVGDNLGVMAAADALIIPREVADAAAQRLQQESGLLREQLYLGATHTHASLGGWGQGFVAESFAGGFQPEARIWFADCIVTAVKGALADLKPAQFGYGQFAAPEFIRNRLVGSLGKVDAEFNYALVKQDSGKVAVIGVYGAHATVLSSDTMEFSGDYPGYWQRAVEEFSGGRALFFAGGVGSHSPVSGGKGFEGAEKMGRALAEKLISHLPTTPMTNRVTLGTLGLEVTMPSLNVRLSDGVRLRPWLSAKLLRPAARSFIQVFRINNSIWISTPCDFSGELALGIKDSLEVRGTSATITSFNGDYVGYVIPSRYYHLKGYEPRVMSFFGPNVPDYFDEIMRTMAGVLITN